MARLEPDMFKTPDSQNSYCEEQYLNTFWRNTKTGDVYQIISYIFDADDDVWKIVYIRHGGTGIEYSRRMQNFFGKNNRGDFRFSRVYPDFMPPLEERVS